MRTGSEANITIVTVGFHDDTYDVYVLAATMALLTLTTVLSQIPSLSWINHKVTRTLMAKIAKSIETVKRDSFPECKSLGLIPSSFIPLDDLN